MTLLKLCLVAVVTWVISMHIYIEISKQNNNKVGNYITKCLALSRNVEDKIKLPGLRSNPEFYAKVKDAVVKECVKLEIIR